mmetsp:Transcript_15826/g.26700  ORF Transcript_15826/g.26700 Transcript_15826/m.26700 type:complete len:388 (+) Transcript_15826:162-1325(+)
MNLRHIEFYRSQNLQLSAQKDQVECELNGVIDDLKDQLDLMVLENQCGLMKEGSELEISAANEMQQRLNQSIAQDYGQEFEGEEPFSPAQKSNVQFYRSKELAFNEGIRLLTQESLIKSRGDFMVKIQEGLQPELPLFDQLSEMGEEEQREAPLPLSDRRMSYSQVVEAELRQKLDGSYSFQKGGRTPDNIDDRDVELEKIHDSIDSKLDQLQIDVREAQNESPYTSEQRAENDKTLLQTTSGLNATRQHHVSMQSEQVSSSTQKLIADAPSNPHQTKIVRLMKPEYNQLNTSEEKSRHHSFHSNNLSANISRFNQVSFRSAAPYRKDFEFFKLLLLSHQLNHRKFNVIKGINAEHLYAVAKTELGLNFNQYNHFIQRHIDSYLKGM